MVQPGWLVQGFPRSLSPNRPKYDHLTRVWCWLGHLRAQPTPPCMEVEWRQLMAFDLPPEVVDVILAARRPSTKSVYEGRWEKFVVWCSSRTSNP